MAFLAVLTIAGLVLWFVYWAGFSDDLARARPGPQPLTLDDVIDFGLALEATPDVVSALRTESSRRGRRRAGSGTLDAPGARTQGSDGANPPGGLPPRAPRV